MTQDVVRSGDVEEKLRQRQRQQKKELRKKLITGYQSRTKNKNLQETLRTYGEMSWEDLSNKLGKQEKKDDKLNR